MAQTHFNLELHDFRDQNGNTPLWVAAVNKNVEAFRELIKLGADVNVKCENGNTILHRLMLNKDTDPESIRDMRNEQIINILLNNGQQFSKKDLADHVKFHEKVGTMYEYLFDQNRANIRLLNDANKTALYYSTHDRKEKFGWQNEVGNVMNYDQISKGDLRSKIDKDMRKLQKKVSKDEYMLAIYEMRRRKSKQPTSLTLEQEDRARLRFESNKIKEPKTVQ